jgi:murein DD-endopeptidase MepM/ murein hydrolase activator NlpD
MVAELRCPETERVAEIRGSLLGVRPTFYEEGGRWVALVAVPASAQAGRTPFYLKVQFQSGNHYGDIVDVEVTPRSFPTQHLSMPSSKRKLMDPDLLARERELLYAAFRNSSPRQNWDGKFLIPVSGRPSSPFGRKRYVNGKWWGQHQGTDIAAATGTPVRSDAAGTVVFARDLQMRGKTIVVDHGRSLFSAYNHLSRIGVSVGQAVERGQVIGAVGATGFVTGAHLHWEVRVGLTPVDPMRLAETLLSTRTGPSGNTRPAR